jgi:hypothetical protein
VKAMEYRRLERLVESNRRDSLQDITTNQHVGLISFRNIVFVCIFPQKLLDFGVLL